MTYSSHNLCGHPALYELAATSAGWNSRADRDTARGELLAGARAILDWCDNQDVILPTFAHLLDALDGRVQAGVVVVTATPWKDGAVGALCVEVARDAFREYVAAKRAAARPEMSVTDGGEDDDDMAHPFGARRAAA